tara:strand:- start:159 stop:440 length:282 start_codon:yes stop_codon:yes gene_type:complete
MIALTRAPIGLAIAKMGPRTAYEKEIESTPVSGVATKKEEVAPFEAPALRMANAVGITPHEHSGNGAPMNAPLAIDENPFGASCLSTQLLGMT